uniref:Cytochrome b561 domain-containing protein n=1 Tax=Phytophthora ramorum TaxID=164328 RepID=H3H8K3_PHYRM
MGRPSELLLTATLFLLPCAIILERCMADASLFSLHPALNALAMLVCLPSVWLTKLHLLLNVSAGALVAAAGVAVYIAKKNDGSPHLTTPHSWAALVTGMFFALNVFQGLLLTFEGD